MFESIPSSCSFSLLRLHTLLALACCLTTNSLAAQDYQRKHYTIAHRILEFESIACDVTDAHYIILDRLIDKAIDLVKYDSTETDIAARESQAVQALKTISKILDDFGFRLRVPTQNLCAALTPQDGGEGKEYFPYDCDTSSFIYLGIADKLGLPLSLIEVRNVGKTANHNFVRWEVGGGIHVDWDTNERRTRELAKPRGIYGTPYNERRLFAYLLYSRGLDWERKGDLRREHCAYRLSIMMDPELPHAPNNLAWDFVADSRARKLVTSEDALKYARFAVSVDRDPNYLDTLAGVHAELGDLDTAIRIQKEVVDELNRKEFRERLEGYEAGLTVEEQNRAAREP